MFKNEHQFFSIISEKADVMIKEKQGLVKPKPNERISEQERQNQVKEYMRTMKNMEKIDKPNSLLF